MTSPTIPEPPGDWSITPDLTVKSMTLIIEGVLNQHTNNPKLKADIVAFLRELLNPHLIEAMGELVGCVVFKELLKQEGGMKDSFSTIVMSQPPSTSEFERDTATVSNAIEIYTTYGMLARQCDSDAFKKEVEEATKWQAGLDHEESTSRSCADVITVCIIHRGSPKLKTSKAFAQEVQKFGGCYHMGKNAFLLTEYFGRGVLAELGHLRHKLVLLDHDMLAAVLRILTVQPGIKKLFRAHEKNIVGVIMLGNEQETE